MKLTATKVPCSSIVGQVIRLRDEQGRSIGQLGIHGVPGNAYHAMANAIADAVVGAINGAGATNEWQPIETAPLDQTEVFGMDAKGCVRAIWFFKPSSNPTWLTIDSGREFKPVYWCRMPDRRQVLTALHEMNNADALARHRAAKRG